MSCVVHLCAEDQCSAPEEEGWNVLASAAIVGKVPYMATRSGVAADAFALAFQDYWVDWSQNFLVAAVAPSGKDSNVGQRSPKASEKLTLRSLISMF